MDFVNSSVLWPTVQQEWPLRLLDVRSMTSVERTRESSYGQDEAPNYGILSYTWGRFETDSGGHLNISGVQWPIPAIEISHFSVEQFESVLRRMTSSAEQWKSRSYSYDYVWLDVACINQDKSKESEAEKMHQVGRQAGIFRRAKEAYIWLNRLDPDQLSNCVQDLLKTTYKIAKKECDFEEVLWSLIISLETLFQDPWFSSLWTLQESVLKRNAFIVDKNGDFVIAPGPWAGQDTRVLLIDISTACELLATLLDPTRRTGHNRTVTYSQSREFEGLQILEGLIVKSGVGFSLSMNPNIQYGVAQFRQTKYEEDRIYAIMQVYGFRLGKTVNPKKEYTAAQLEVQFLIAICQVPLLSQAFIHMKDNARGQSWAITSETTVPRRLHKILASREHLSNACKIRVANRSCASFDGMVCTLGELKNHWVVSGKHIISNAPVGTALSIFLDHNKAILRDLAGVSCEWPPYTNEVDDNAEFVTETSPDALRQSLETVQELCDRVSNTFGADNVYVLYLGRSTYVSTIDLGIILIRQKSGILPWCVRRDLWVRVGVCVWTASSGNGLLPGSERPATTSSLRQAYSLKSKPRITQSGKFLALHAFKGTFG
jgi:Heterokaryon incompatibility protein (HET)